MCWTLFKTNGHLKNLGTSQKLFATPSVASWLRAWWKTGPLHNNKPYQTNMVHILLGVWTRWIRHFFVGPGRIPIFCVHFCLSICLIRHLFLSLRSVLFG